MKLNMEKRFIIGNQVDQGKEYPNAYQTHEEMLNFISQENAHLKLQYTHQIRKNIFRKYGAIYGQEYDKWIIYSGLTILQNTLTLSSKIKDTHSQMPSYPSDLAVHERQKMYTHFHKALL